MKNNTWLLNGFCLTLLLTVSGCRESYTVVTSLLPDGSCDRIITVTSDTLKIPDVAFPLPIDSSWQTSWKPPAQKGEKYLFTARKHFAHIDSLCEEYASGSDSEKIKITIKAERTFRWFYTYFTYQEKYEAFSPWKLVPLSQFMTAEEIQRYLAGEKSDSLKKKQDAWESRNMFEYGYQGLVAAALRLNDPSLPTSLIQSKKEDLFTELMSSGSKDAVKTIANVLGTPAVRKLTREINALVEEIARKSKVESKADGDYLNTVVMLGTILDTNAREVKGNSAVWRFTSEQFGVADYEMRVESRSVNVWPLAVTGLVVLALIIIPGVIRLRRERKFASTHG